VMVKGGMILNRYWDDSATPRPEAFKEDTHVKEQSGREGEDIYRDLRAAAESGWDFCTRWFDTGQGLTTIHTTDIVPPDLNALMYHLEQSLASAYAMKSDTSNAAKYKKLAEQRRDAVMSLLWDPQKNYFMDYNFRKGELTGIESLAGMYPLFCRIPSPAIAGKASATLKRDFLKPGGLVTTLTDSGQQWDAPNGWAPLQWVSYAGLKNYGQDRLADEISKRWLHLNEKVFHSTGKMMEKYNVMDTTVVGGGGEYPNQDGFGWTNGIDLVFLTATKK
jgi:alpha,alpha-trehalase